MIRKLYSTIAIISLNLIILFVVVNIIARYILHLQNQSITEKYGFEDLRKVYSPEMDSQHIRRLLNETWSLKYVYESFVQFKEQQFRGKYVNVSEHGFRYINNQEVYPPPCQKNI